MRFTEIRKDTPAQDGRKPFMVAVDTENREVLIFGEASQQAVRDHVKSGGTNDLPGEVRTANKRDGSGTYLAWSLPTDRRTSNGGFRRDPVQEIVGIAHYQAMEIIFGSRPEGTKLSEFWTSARPHVRKMAKEIAEDRLALQKELQA